MALRNLIVIAALLGFAGAAFGQATPDAHANIMNPDGTVIGTAVITKQGSGIKILLNVATMPEGVHGIHIHAVGKCEGPAFASAGGHLNPDMKMHGKDNPMGPHAGDMENITIGGGGVGRTTLTDDKVTVDGTGPNSLFHPGGTAIVIHAMPDDYKTDPAGNSGARIACGVIEKN